MSADGFLQFTEYRAKTKLSVSITTPAAYDGAHDREGGRFYFAAHDNDATQVLTIRRTGRFGSRAVKTPEFHKGLRKALTTR